MIIKIASFCASILVVSASAPTGIDIHNTGVSSTSKHQDSHGNYAFAYDIVDEHGASNSRSETGDAFGNKKGSYSLYDTDGRARTVNYIADEHGFRVVVNTNEPGTAQSYPAGAIINSPYQEPAAPDASPVSIVHDAPVPVSRHAHSAPYPTKSIVSHAVPVPVFDHVTPVAASHAVPSAYSIKSILSHDTPVPIAPVVPISYSHSLPLAYPEQKSISHATPQIAGTYSTPLAYSTKYAVPHAASVQNVVHVTPQKTAGPAYTSYLPKSMMSNSVPAVPARARRYKALYNRGLGSDNIGYNHGLLGPRIGGLTYNTKFYNHGLRNREFRRLFGRNYGNGYHGYGYEKLGPYMRSVAHDNGIYDYDGLQSYYY